MLTPDISGPVRVSILERLVPSFAFAIAAITGAVGGLMIFRFFSTLRHAETAGIEAFLSGMAEIEMVGGGMLVFAAVLCAIGIVVSVVRLFTANATASPPGILFLMTGLLSLVPAFAVHYVLHLVKGVALSPDPADGSVSAIADTVMAVSYFAIGSGVVIALVLLAFPFIPFSSRRGRKSSPLVCLMLVAIVIAALAGIYFWEARTSSTELDKSRAKEEEDVRVSRESSLETPDANSFEDDLDTITNEADDTDDTDSNSQGKAIDGGVLNAKAIDLPQPPYPPAARAVRATGTVTVRVTVDEKGNVISANALSGHPLLRAAAVQAARHARFKPMYLRGDLVRVNGVVTYNFSDQ